MKALIVCTNKELADDISVLLNGLNVTDIIISDGSDARKTAAEQEIQLIITVLPLINEFGLDTAVFMSSVSNAEQIVLVPVKAYDNAVSKTVGLNLSLLPKNSPRSLVMNAVSRAIAARISMENALKKTTELETKLHDEQLISRAKYVMMEYLKVTEEVAHRILRKRAMDDRVPMRDAAVEILNIYQPRKLDNE